MDGKRTLMDAEETAADMNAETEFFFAPTGGAAYWSGIRWVMLDDMCDPPGPGAIASEKRDV